jgi:type I restriction enzyme S subunit
MEVRPGYKQTEVGVIPEEWECAKLEEYFSFISYGFTNPMPTVEHGIYMVTAADIDEGRIQLETARRTTETAYRTLLTPKSKPQKNDILLTKDGTLGRLGLVGDEVICINQSVAIIRPNRKVEPLFLKLLLESPRYQRRMLEDAGGSTIKHIYISIVNSMRIAVPSNRAEQRIIAEALSDVDELLRTQDRLIVKKRDLKQAAMQQLLTSETRLPGFHREWVVKTLGDLGSTYGGLTGKTKADFGEGSGHYVTFMNVMTNVVIDCGTFERVRVSPTESQNRVAKGDLLFNGSSETPEEVAMCAVLAADVRDLFLNSFCFGFRFRDGAEADGLFLAYYLRSNEGRELMKSLAQGSTRYNLSKIALLKSPLRLPSLPEQTAIAAVLTDMDAELLALEQRREKTRDLKQAMMQELLTGKTRLI